MEVYSLFPPPKKYVLWMQKDLDHSPLMLKHLCFFEGCGKRWGQLDASCLCLDLGLPSSLSRKQQPAILVEILSKLVNPDGYVGEMSHRTRTKGTYFWTESTKWDSIFISFSELPSWAWASGMWLSQGLCPFPSPTKPRLCCVAGLRQESYLTSLQL